MTTNGSGNRFLYDIGTDEVFPIIVDGLGSREIHNHEDRNGDSDKLCGLFAVNVIKLKKAAFTLNELELFANGDNAAPVIDI